MRAIASPAVAAALILASAGPAGADIVKPKPVKQSGPANPASPSAANATDQPPAPRTKQDPCADVHTYRTTAARAMCVAERGFPQVPDGE
ncbi:MAG: hypothetical protein J0J06_01995 [Sphingomonas sp.]|uniref:hypothetical protein n=1 Tax=Sphingomonas sp. TaxID=28214 RepID=UPI001AD1CD28|nr:hypothetical protein [Sphingomonas sp.]MBN8814202.1 hypothetical protein [Sphingomonas sp.]